MLQKSITRYRFNVNSEQIYTLPSFIIMSLKCMKGKRNHREYLPIYKLYNQLEYFLGQLFKNDFGETLTIKLVT